MSLPGFLRGLLIPLRNGKNHVRAIVESFEAGLAKQRYMESMPSAEEMEAYP
ncbi:hypothetical protein OBV_43680 [Oscillibacter valericigenes Sjm18-20]|nr:hypothetical protein OBV_43680 [Oscillibacter valericigenes Sjm18-20]